MIVGCGVRDDVIVGDDVVVGIDDDIGFFVVFIVGCYGDRDY